MAEHIQKIEGMISRISTRNYLKFIYGDFRIKTVTEDKPSMLEARYSVSHPVDSHDNQWTSDIQNRQGPLLG